MNNTRLYAYDKDGRRLQATNAMPAIGYRANEIIWTTNPKRDKNGKSIVGQNPDTDEGKGAEVDYFELVHHTSTIMRIHKDGSFDYPTGVYSNTTKDRLQKYGPYRVYQDDWEWYIDLPENPRQEFQWGCSISPTGAYSSKNNKRILYDPELTILDEPLPHTICLGSDVWWRHWVIQQGRIQKITSTDCSCED